MTQFFSCFPLETFQRFLAKLLHYKVGALNGFVQKESAEYGTGIVLGLLVHEVIGVDFSFVHVDVLGAQLCIFALIHLVKSLNQSEFLLVGWTRIDIQRIHLFE
jgi:hypothetical protein